MTDACSTEWNNFTPVTSGEAQSVKQIADLCRKWNDPEMPTDLSGHVNLGTFQGPLSTFQGPGGVELLRWIGCARFTIPPTLMREFIALVEKFSTPQFRKIALSVVEWEIKTGGLTDERHDSLALVEHMFLAHSLYCARNEGSSRFDLQQIFDVGVKTIVLEEVIGDAISTIDESAFGGDARAFSLGVRIYLDIGEKLLKRFEISRESTFAASAFSPEPIYRPILSEEKLVRAAKSRYFTFAVESPLFLEFAVSSDVYTQVKEIVGDPRLLVCMNVGEEDRRELGTNVWSYVMKHDGALGKSVASEIMSDYLDTEFLAPIEEVVGEFDYLMG